jgi:NTP pyrophosphatase (non-canonical NTP hydrolase)
MKREQFVDAGIDDKDIIELIQKENYRQISKWGFQQHDLFEWHTYTSEELGEMAKAISEYVYRDGRLEDVIKEAIQTATLAIKIAIMAKKKLLDTGGEEKK